jgi:hypothetical protein
LTVLLLDTAAAAMRFALTALERVADEARLEELDRAEDLGRLARPMDADADTAATADDARP